MHKYFSSRYPCASLTPFTNKKVELSKDIPLSGYASYSLCMLMHCTAIQKAHR